jgi:hypothetical protein
MSSSDNANIQATSIGAYYDGGYGAASVATSMSTAHGRPAAVAVFDHAPAGAGFAASSMNTNARSGDASPDSAASALEQFDALVALLTAAHGGHPSNRNAAASSLTLLRPKLKTKVHEPARDNASSASHDKATVDNNGEHNIEVVYYLATDSAEVRNRAREALGDALKTYSMPPGVNLPGGAGAALDTFLLSACDEVIITWPKSTFGVIGTQICNDACFTISSATSAGAALGPTGLPPYVVHSGSKRSNECTRLASCRDT